MKWIIEDIKELFAQLLRWQTWLVIGLLALFALLAYLVAGFALRTDSVLNFVRQKTGNCRELNNTLIILLFTGMIFFTFTSVLTLGELQRYFRAIRRGALAAARQALIWAGFWAFIAVLIAVSALVFFNTFCH